MSTTEQLVRPIQEPSFSNIARRVVNDSLRIQPDEQVALFTWDHTLPQARALALEVEKTGGVSTTVLLDNEFYWSYLKQVPIAQFERKQKAQLALLDETDAAIQLGGPENPSNFTNIPNDRAAKWVSGQQEMADKFTENKIRTINLPIGLITRERAKTYGFNYDNWLRIFNNSLNVDYSKLALTGNKLAKKIENGTSLHITSPSGTDLRLKLRGRPVHVRDGILDQMDLGKGTLFETLPAGVIEHAPDETSAEGVVQFEQPIAMAGKNVKGLRFEFANGQLTKYTAQENLDVFKGLYENATGDKNRVGTLAIGLNPGAEPIGFFTDRLVQGYVSVGIGGNNGIGGDNNNIYGAEGGLRRATLEVNGERLVADGKLLVM